jgi:hypothetical protein
MTPFSLKLPNGQTYTFSDWGDYEIYARAEFAGGQAQDIILFQAVESNDLPGGLAAQATLLDSNLEQPSSLPVDNQMVVMSIQIKPDEANSLDGTAPGTVDPEATSTAGWLKWQNVFQNTFFTFTLSRSKPFAEGPISSFPCGGGLYLQSTTTDTTAEAYNMSNGFPSAISARLLALPIWIGTMQTFRGKYKFPRGALDAVSVDSTVGLTTFLYGPRQRPVT